jgi:hypothetical protein
MNSTLHLIRRPKWHSAWSQLVCLAAIALLPIGCVTTPSDEEDSGRESEASEHSPPLDDEELGTASDPLTSDWITIAGSTPHGIAAQAFNGTLFMFTVGGDNKIYKTTSTNGSSWSSSTEFGGTTNRPLATATFAGQMFVFAIGLNDKQIYFSKTSNGSSFSGWTSLGGSTDAAVAATAHNGTLHIMAKGINDDRLYTSSSTNGSSFSAWTGYGTLTTEAAPAMASHGGNLHVFVSSKATSNEIFRTTAVPPAASVGWIPTDEYSTDVSVSVLDTDDGSDAGDMYVFARRSDNSVTMMMRGRGNVWFPYRFLWGSIQAGAAIGATTFDNALWTFRRTTSGSIRVKSSWTHAFPFSVQSGWEVSKGNADDTNPHGGEQEFSLDLVRKSSGVNITSGSAIRAIRGGTVEFVDYRNSCKWDGPTGSCVECVDASPNANCTCGYGNAVAIRHADGTVATYAHLINETAVVSQGATVATGDVIGHAGTTGSSSGPHLHVALCNPQWGISQPVPNQCNYTGCVALPSYFSDNDSNGFRPQSGDSLNLP